MLIASVSKAELNMPEEELNVKEMEVIKNIYVNNGRITVKALSQMSKIDLNTLNSIIEKLRKLGIINKREMTIKKAKISRKRGGNELAERLLFDMLSKRRRKEITIKGLKRILGEELATIAIGKGIDIGLIKIESNKVKLIKSNFPYTLEEKILERIVEGEEVIVERLSKNVEEALKKLVDRGLIKLREEKVNSITLTEKGLEIAKRLRRMEIIGALDENDIVEEKWRKKKLKKYDFKTQPLPVKFGEEHLAIQYLRRIKTFLELYGFVEVESGVITSELWSFDMLNYNQEHPRRAINKLYYVKNVELKEEINFEKVKEYQESIWGYKWSRERAKRIILSINPASFLIRTSSENTNLKRVYTVSRVLLEGRGEDGRPLEKILIGALDYSPNVNLSKLLYLCKLLLSHLGFEEFSVSPIYLPYARPAFKVEVQGNGIIEGGLLRQEICEVLELDGGIVFNIDLEHIIKCRVKDFKCFSKKLEALGRR